MDLILQNFSIKTTLSCFYGPPILVSKIRFATIGAYNISSLNFALPFGWDLMSVGGMQILFLVRLNTIVQIQWHLRLPIGI